MRYTKILAGVAIASTLMAGTAFAAGYTYKLIDKIALPEKAGHGDIVTYDPTNAYLYVSMTSGAAVIDTKTNKIIHVFKSVDAPNGNDFDDNYVYWTDAGGPGKTNQVVVISKKTWKIVNRVNTTGTSPDGVWVDTANNRLYVGMDDNNWVDVYTLGENPKFVTKYLLDPKDPKAGPDVGVLIPSMNTLYMPDDSLEEAIDLTTGKIKKEVNLHLKLLKHGGTKSQIYDDKSNMLWVGSTNNAIFVMNPDTLDVIKKLPAKGGGDQVSFDPGLNLVYMFEGGAKGFDVYDATNMEHVTFVSTGVGSTHSGDVDTATHNVYAQAGKAAAIYVYKPEPK